MLLYCSTATGRVIDLNGIAPEGSLEISTYLYDLDKGDYLNFGQHFDRLCQPCRLRLVVHNSADQVVHNYLYLRKGHEGTRILSDYGVLPVIIRSYNYDFYLITVLPQSTDTLNIEHYHPTHYGYFGRILGKSTVYKKLSEIIPKPFDERYFFKYGFYAILIITAIFSFSFFINLKHRYFLYYTVYNIVTATFFYLNNSVTFDIAGIRQVPQLFNSAWLPLFQALMIIAYFVFVANFIETRRKFKAVHLLITVTIIISLAFIFLVIGFFNSNTVPFQIYGIYRILIVILCITMISMMIGKKEPHIRLIVIGTSFMLLGSMLTMYAIYFSEMVLWGLRSTYYMQTGILLEIVFFSVAIAYKSYVTTRDKFKLQKEVEDMLEHNLSIAEQKELELQKKVEESREIILKQEADRMNAVIELKQKELEMQVLRSQINPHFLFNSINALKIFIHRRDYDAALLYFEKFSRLLRLILENTFERHISLEAELECLKLYVDIENLRLEYAVTLNIQTDGQIDAQFTRIPAMVLQPFVENSIWHGLVHKNKPGGVIDISIDLDDKENLTICIRDNGIGRETAKSFKSSTQNHKSLGTLITRQRLNLINEDGQNVIYRDLYHEDGQSAGTEVCIRIITAL